MQFFSNKRHVIYSNLIICFLGQILGFLFLFILGDSWISAMIIPFGTIIVGFIFMKGRLTNIINTKIEMDDVYIRMDDPSVRYEFKWSEIDRVEKRFLNIQLVSNGYKFSISTDIKDYREAWKLVTEQVEKNNKKAFIDNSLKKYL